MYRCTYMLLACVLLASLISCGGDSDTPLNSTVSPAPVVEATGSPTSSRTASGWEDSFVLLLPLPVDLEDELDYVADVLYVQDGFTHYIAANGSLDERRALAFFTCAVDNDIIFDQLCLRTTPAIEGYYDTQIDTLATLFGATVVETIFIPHKMTTYYYLKWTTDRTRQNLWAYSNACLSNYNYIQYAGTVALGEFDDAPGDSGVEYEPGQSYSLMNVSAPIAWENTRGTYTDGSSVVVAIFDSGLTLNHEDYVGRWINAGNNLPYYTAYYRVNFTGLGGISEYYNPEDCGASDYHGTGVAGVLCANTNGIGEVDPMRLARIHSSANMTGQARIRHQSRQAHHQTRRAPRFRHTGGR